MFTYIAQTGINETQMEEIPEHTHTHSYSTNDERDFQLTKDKKREDDRNLYSFLCRFAHSIIIISQQIFNLFHFQSF